MFERNFGTIPSNVDDLQPGPELGGVLACFDVEDVSPYDKIVLLRAHTRQRAFHDAEYYDCIASVADDMQAIDEDPRSALESASTEIRAALRLTRTAADSDLAFALELRRRLGVVWLALAEGRIDLRRAKTIARGTEHLAAAAAQHVAGRIIEHAPSLTTGQLKARVDRLAMEVDPEAAKHRYDHAVKERRIVSEAASAGTGHLLGLDLPPHRVAAIRRRIERHARKLKKRGDARSMDQLRADLFMDWLQGRDATADKGTIHLQVDLDTLAALSAHPGELNGYGPVVSDISRQVAEQNVAAEWRFSVTDTATGSLMHTGVTRRRPTAAQRRDVESRNPTCIFPGFRMPSVECDVDHRQRWADGGVTECCNLAPLCRHDHINKDQRGWSYRPLANGDYLWTSPLGHSYTTSGLPP